MGLTPKGDACGGREHRYGLQRGEAISVRGAPSRAKRHCIPSGDESTTNSPAGVRACGRRAFARETIGYVTCRKMVSR